MSFAYPWPESGSGWRDEMGFNKYKRSPKYKGSGGMEKISRRHRDSDGNILFLSEIQIWSSMFSRCYTKSSSAYFYYGNRGIKICPRWRSFYNFIEDIGPRPSGRHSIERVDNSKGYNPENCVWALPEAQAANRRSKSKARAAACRAFRDSHKRVEKAA